MITHTGTSALEARFPLATSARKMIPIVFCASLVPPISACDDDDGSPSAQVARFQAIAPTSPAKTVSSVTEPASTMPLAIVAATSSDRNAPTKFSVADIATATRGDIARVETDV